MTHRDDPAIAVVGMAALFPGARDLDQYRANIEGGFDAITEVPAGRWDAIYYDPSSKAIDRIYCHRGGFVDENASFDALGFGVMPVAASGAEPDQLLALQVAEAALRDAGEGAARSLGRAGVILGRGGYVNAGVARLEQRVRAAEQLVQSLRVLAPDVAEAELARVKAEFQEAVGAVGAGDSFIGLVPNLAASRIANRLDLRGPAYAIDAACASSLVALDHARRELLSGRCDLVIAGGVHLCHEVTFWAGFCQLGAVSRAQSIRPFDRRADGLLLGEGIGMVALRRLEDAERDGSRIYAVLRGSAVTSDGRDASLLSPSIEGQVRALREAWSESRLDPETVGLIEAHGTATPTGDAAELATLAQVFGPPERDEARAALGTIKSMIGHAMPAAGIAGFIKAALAVHHGVLPPTLHAEEPHENLARTRFRLIHEAEPWEGRVRRAGVNAFGFGGINAHVVLEAHESALKSPPRSAKGKTEAAAEEPLLLLSASDPKALLRALDEGTSAIGDGLCRLALFDPTPERKARAKAIIERGAPWPGRGDTYFSPRGLLAEGGKIAFAFPGVDASFEPRIEDVAAHFERPLPRMGKTEGLERIGAGIIGVGRLLDGVLRAIGVTPDFVCGHSIGEWNGMIATGAVSESDLEPFLDSLSEGSLDVPGVAFAAVGCGADKADEAMSDLSQIAISHDNCPHQVILCGVETSIDVALARLTGRGVLCQKLSFRSGYHSPLFADYLAPYRENVARLRLRAPETPLWSATTAAPYPTSPEAVGALAIEHLIRPVRFRELSLALHDAGARVFIQVGTGSLVGFLDDTLRGKPHLAISANVPQRSGLAQLRRVAAALFVEGASEPASWLLQGQKGPAPRPKGKRMPLALGAPLVHLTTPLTRPPGAARAPETPGRLGDELRATLREIAAAEDVVQAALSKRGAPRPSRAPAPPPAPGPREAITEHLLSVETVPALEDHSFYPQPKGWPHIEDRYPVVPLTMMIAMMLEAAAKLVPERIPIAIENLGAYRWMAVAPPLTAQIRARYDGERAVEVAIEGYAVATVIVSKSPQKEGDFAVEPLVNERPAPLAAEVLYRDGWMFHGPRYQGIETLGPLGDSGIDGRLRQLASPGGLLDNAGQLLGYWVMENSTVDRLAMPVRVGRVAFFGEPPKTGELCDCRVRIRHFDSTDVRADMELRHEGRVWARIEGWEDRRFDTDEQSFPLLKAPDRRTLSRMRDAGYALLVEPRRSIPSTERLIRRYLGKAERAALDRVPLRERHTSLLARVALKDAVRAALWQKGEGPLFPIEVAIEDDASGRPRLGGRFEGRLHLAVATRGDVAVAVASSAPTSVALIEDQGDGVARERAAIAAYAALQNVPAAGLRVTAREGERLAVEGVWFETRSEPPNVVACPSAPSPTHFAG